MATIGRPKGALNDSFSQADIRRGIIVTTLMEQPGLSYRELMRATGLAAGSLHHHRMVLMRCGILEERRVENKLHYWIDDVDPMDILSSQELAVYELAPTAAQQQDILDTLPYPRSTTQHVLGRLQRKGFLICKQRPRSKSYVHNTPEWAA